MSEERMKIPPALRSLETARLRLRMPVLEDRDGVWSAAHHPADITKGMVWDPPKEKGDADEFTLMALKEWEDGDHFVWSIDDKGTGAFIGRVAILRRENKNFRWYIGYWLHPDHHGKGLMTEACRAAFDAVFTHLPVDSIISSHASWNEASGKVLRKIGMRHVGHDPEGFHKHGKNHPEEQYELTREEWEGGRAR